MNKKRYIAIAFTGVLGCTIETLPTSSKEKIIIARIFEENRQTQNRASYTAYDLQSTETIKIQDLFQDGNADCSIKKEEAQIAYITSDIQNNGCVVNYRFVDRKEIPENTDLEYFLKSHPGSRVILQEYIGAQDLASAVKQWEVSHSLITIPPSKLPLKKEYIVEVPQ